MNSSGESSPDSYNILPRLQKLGAIGCGLILLYSLRFWSSGDVLRIVGVGILVAGASLSSGLLLGFIFGIPRVGDEKATAKKDADPGDVKRASAQTKPNNVTSNSNLVEISDWLTKILVGVGLVELTSIPHKLGKLSYYLGLGLRPAQCGGPQPCADLLSSGQVAGLATLLFYFTLGFLGSYIWTRLYFYKDLRGTVEDLQRNNNLLDLMFRAEAFIKEGHLDDAMESVNRALADDPGDGRAILVKARILKRQAMEIQGGEATKVDKPEAKKLMLAALDCVNQAVALLPSYGEPIYNKACYQALLGFDKSDVLGSLKTAFALNPGLRNIANEDSDLASLKQDDDFKELMKRQP